MNSKSRRQRYTRQWKCARKSLTERIIGEQSKCLPVTSQHGQDQVNVDERNDKDIWGAFKCAETGVSEEDCRLGQESEDNGVSDENCSSEHENEDHVFSEDNCTSGPEDVNQMSPASLATFLQGWATKHLIKHIAIDDLLKGLRQNGHPELPLTARTLLQTPRHIKT